MFKWYRKLLGGRWARFDNAHYGSYAFDDWVQITDLMDEDWSNVRIAELEDYTTEGVK